MALQKTFLNVFLAVRVTLQNIFLNGSQTILFMKKRSAAKTRVENLQLSTYRLWQKKMRKTPIPNPTVCSGKNIF